MTRMNLLSKLKFKGFAIKQSRTLLLALAVGGIALHACSPLYSDTGDPPPSEISHVVSADSQRPSEAPTPFTIFKPTPRPTQSPPPTATPLQAQEPVFPPSEIAATVDSLVEGEPGVYGIAILDSSGEFLYARNATLPFVAASLYKLVLLAEIYRQIETGEITLATEVTLSPDYFDGRVDYPDSYFTPESEGDVATVEEMLLAAGAYSSNVAARALLAQTSDDQLKQMADSIGMPDTHFLVIPQEIPSWPERFANSENPDAIEAVAFVETQALSRRLNVTTPQDIGRYWTALLQGEIVSESASSAILDILTQQVITDRIPMLIPDSITTANKTGNVDFATHDSGVIFDPENTVIVVVLTQGEPDLQRGVQIIQRIALAATGETELPPIE